MEPKQNRKNKRHPRKEDEDKQNKHLSKHAGLLSKKKKRSTIRHQKWGNLTY